MAEIDGIFCLGHACEINQCEMLSVIMLDWNRWLITLEMLW